MLLGLVYPVPPMAFVPQPDFYPDIEKLPGLHYCGRFYSCGCGLRTGWRYAVDNVVGCICSTECLEAFLKEDSTAALATSPEPAVASIPPDVAA